MCVARRISIGNWNDISFDAVDTICEAIWSLSAACKRSLIRNDRLSKLLITNFFDHFLSIRLLIIPHFLTRDEKIFNVFLINGIHFELRLCLNSQIIWFLWVLLLVQLNLKLSFKGLMNCSNISIYHELERSLLPCEFRHRISLNLFESIAASSHTKNPDWLIECFLELGFRQICKHRGIVANETAVQEQIFHAIFV